MRASILLLGSAVLVLASACSAPLEGAPPCTVAPPAATSASGGHWISAPDEAPMRASPRVLFREPAASILIGEKAPPPEPERPRSRGRVDVSFHKADLDNALRFLADAGRFNLVVESGLSGEVTAELRAVDAFDALVSIAEANGAVVRYHRGIVTVKRTAVAR